MAEENGNGGGLQPPPPPPEEGGGGAPEWMATFADLVTLLMCFFVLLFAMSTTQEESFKELVKSLQSALGVQQLPEAGTREGLIMLNVPDQEVKTEAIDELGGMVQKEVNEIVSDVRELIMFNKLAGMVRVYENEDGAVISISDMVLFPAGAVSMSADGLEIMEKVALVLKQFSYRIKVAGHTDNSPITTARFPSNWELSSHRASSVVRFLIKQGIDPTLLSAEGYAQYRPVATNDTPEGRGQNRRVEIVYERNSIARAIEEQAEE